MTEERFWSAYVKPALNHRALDRVAWKVGTSTRAGIPDVLFRSADAVAWLELKRLVEWPKRETTPLRLGLSVEQRAHLREWAGERRCGHAYVLVLIAADVLLLPHWTPDVIQRDQLEELTLLRLPLPRVKAELGRRLEALLRPASPAAKEGAWVELP